MTRLHIRLISLLLFAILCATLTYWAVTLGSRDSAPLNAAAVDSPPVSIERAAVLFGAKPERGQNSDIHLSGILALGVGRGAAAIISVGDAPARAVSLNSPIGNGATLAQVRARSIVIERHGVRSEIFLPANGPGTTIYVR